ADQRGRKPGKDADRVVGAVRRIGELRLARRLALGPLPTERVLAGVARVLHDEARALGRAAAQRHRRTPAHARVRRLVALEAAGRRTELAHAALTGGLLAVAE